MSDENLMHINGVLYNIKSIIYTYIDSIDESLKDRHDFLILQEFYDSIFPKFVSQIRDSADLLNTSIFFDSLFKDLINIELVANSYLKNEKGLKPTVILSEMSNVVRRVNTLAREFQFMRATSDRIKSEIEPAINEALDDIKIKVGKMDNVLLAIEINKTDEIYKKAEKRFGNKARKYERTFYGTLLISVIIFIISLFFPQLDDSSSIFEYTKYILAKMIILTISITLCTIFSRKGAHFRKLQDQAYQTHLELEAFPLHTNRLDEQDKKELIKELALKYFGKDVDQTQNDKIGDLMQDQLSAGTELIRASAEILKAKNGAKDE